MLTPERRAFKWYASLLPSCRHTLVPQNLSSDPRTAASGDGSLSIYCSVYNADFHRDSVSALRPCLQNQSNVHKNVFRDCVKLVEMQICHIAQWHRGLKRSGKARMPFRTTSAQDDPTWKTTPFNSLLPCWMLIADGLHVS